MALTPQQENRLKMVVAELVQGAVDSSNPTATDELYELTRMNDASLRAIGRAHAIKLRQRIANAQTNNIQQATSLQNQYDEVDGEIGPEVS